MQIHIFTRESLYSTSLIQLLEKKMDLSDHIFVFRKINPKMHSNDVETHIKEVYASNYRSLLIHILPMLLKAKWIYFHYLPYGPSLILWALFPSIIKKSTWIIWGGDVFIYKEKNRSKMTRFYEFLRRLIIPKYPEIASFIEEDAREAMEVYSSTAEYIPILYPIPLNLK